MNREQYRSFVSLLRRQYSATTGILVIMSSETRARPIRLTGCAADDENMLTLTKVRIWDDEDLVYDGELTLELMPKLTAYRICNFEITTATRAARGKQGKLYCLKGKEKCNYGKCKWKCLPMVGTGEVWHVNA